MKTTNVIKSFLRAIMLISLPIAIALGSVTLLATGYYLLYFGIMGCIVFGLAWRASYKSLTRGEYEIH